MTAGDGGGNPAVGGPARHVPVLLPQVLDALRPGPGETIIDGTFGAGGYAAAILATGARVVAIDRDPSAIAAAGPLLAQHPDRLTLVEDRFANIEAVVKRAVGAPVDGVVLDIGVSSMQLDEAERGFSFRRDGPLDMRMGALGATAADVVNTVKAGDLARIIGFYGEERQAGRIARAIERRRVERPFETTLDLAALVGDVVGRRATDRIDPATRTFQALRIHVNDELGELVRALLAAERVLKQGGRLVVVTFHSLEDRIVKRFLRDRAQAAAGSRYLPHVQHEPASFEASGKAVSAGEVEARGNPRARSAKLRTAVRTAAPTRGGEDFADLPNLVDLPQTGVRR